MHKKYLCSTFISPILLLFLSVFALEEFNSVIRSFSLFQSVFDAPEQLSLYNVSLWAGRYGDRIPVGGRDFTHPSRSALRPTQPPIQWEPGVSRGKQRPGRGVDRPPHVAPRLKKEQSYNSTPPLGLRGLFQGDLYLYLLSSIYVHLNEAFRSTL